MAGPRPIGDYTSPSSRTRGFPALGATIGVVVVAIFAIFGLIISSAMGPGDPASYSGSSPDEPPAPSDNVQLASLRIIGDSTKHVEPVVSTAKTDPSEWATTWAEQVRKVNALPRAQRDHYIREVINANAKDTGFTWDDVLEWAKLGNVDARTIQAFNTLEDASFDEIRDKLRGVIGDDVDDLPVCSDKGDFNNTMGLKEGTAKVFLDTEAQLRVSLSPLIKVDGEWKVTCKDRRSSRSGVFVDCWNLWWYGVPPVKETTPVTTPAPTTTPSTGKSTTATNPSGVERPSSSTTTSTTTTTTSLESKNTGVTNPPGVERPAGNGNTVVTTAETRPGAKANALVPNPVTTTTTTTTSAVVRSNTSAGTSGSDAGRSGAGAPEAVGAQNGSVSGCVPAPGSSC
ncbi:hypothetical protein JNJ66_01505 [Candidatus Saccharibacteria bacterium]|nr:hypothetical protein [Candidatus Saccharibacteria bacterium]